MDKSRKIIVALHNYRQSHHHCHHCNVYTVKLQTVIGVARIFYGKIHFFLEKN